MEKKIFIVNVVDFIKEQCLLCGRHYAVNKGGSVLVLHEDEREAGKEMTVVQVCKL